MCHPRGGRSLAVSAALAALAASGCNRELPAGVFHVASGGAVKRLVFPASTETPYAVKPVDVAGRFSFKATYLREPWRAASINVYAYQRSSDGDSLLQESKYAPPFSAGTKARYGFTG